MSKKTTTGGLPRGNNYKIGDIHVWTVGPLVPQATMIITCTINESPQHILLRSSNHSNIRLLNTWREHYWNSLMVHALPIKVYQSQAAKLSGSSSQGLYALKPHTFAELTMLSYWVVSWGCGSVFGIESVLGKHFAYHVPFPWELLSTKVDGSWMVTFCV